MPHWRVAYQLTAVTVPTVTCCNVEAECSCDHIFGFTCPVLSIVNTVLLQASRPEDAASQQLPPEDSDAWLAEGGKDLEEQLAQRQAELDAAKAKSGGKCREGEAAAPGDQFDAHVMAKRMQVQ